MSLDLIPRLQKADIKWDTKPLSDQGALVYGGSFDGHRVTLKQPGNTDDFVNELVHLMSIGHQNVVKLHGIVVSKVLEDNWLVIENCSRGPLSRALGLAHKVKPPISIFQKFQFAIDIANGMNWMHKRPIVHRDLKNDNIFVTEDWVCKVGDMGISHSLPERTSKFSVNEHGDQGSPLYHAPEMLRAKYLGGNKDKQIMNVKLDVWAFGLMLWEIFTQELIFNEYEDAVLFAEDICIKLVRPPKSDAIPIAVQSIIDSCLLEIPQSRPSFAELKEKLEAARLKVFLGFDLEAMEFWKKYWPTQGKVDWFNEVDSKSFLPTLCRELGYPADVTKLKEEKLFHVDLAYLPLHTETSGKPAIISIENFRDILLWFGPFNNVLSFTEVCKQRWFWGAASFDTSRSALFNKDTGTFLVRLNLGKNQPISETPYTITYVNKNKQIEDLRVWLTNNNTAFAVSMYTKQHKNTKIEFARSIAQLIDELKAKTSFLLHPCDSPIYQYLYGFADDPESEYLRKVDVLNKDNQ